MTYQIISERKLRKNVTIRNPGVAYNLVKRYAKNKRELFILLTLNGAHNVISVSIVSIGTVNRTIVHPREIFIRAIKDSAVAIIVCHNHPSNDLKPSNEDIDITGNLYDAGKLLGIPLIDHIVFSKKGYISMRREGLFPKGKKIFYG